MRSKTARAGMALLAASSVAALMSGAHAASPKVEPAKVTEIAGTSLNQLALEPRAVERLGLKTTVIGSSVVARKRTVAAQVLSASGQSRLRTDMPSTASAAPGTLVRVLPIWDAGEIAKDLPARVLSVIRREPFDAKQATFVFAPPADKGALVYQLGGGEQAMRPEQRVLIELSYRPKQQASVPFSAIFYDAKGGAWVYKVSAPLTYVRHAVSVAYVEGETAILTEGPPAGTEIVTQGASLLAGIEFKIGH